MRWRGCRTARSTTPNPPPRTVSRTACWIARTTPGRSQHELGEVPAVLLSGNHAQIARWRRQQALGRTWQRRPDLLDEASLSKADRQLLDAFRAGLAATAEATPDTVEPVAKPAERYVTARHARKNAAIIRGFAVSTARRASRARPRTTGACLGTRPQTKTQQAGPMNKPPQHAPAEFRSRTDPAPAAGLRPRRHRRRQRQGQGRQPRARAGLRRRGHRQARTPA